MASLELPGARPPTRERKLPLLDNLALGAFVLEMTRPRRRDRQSVAASMRVHVRLGLPLDGLHLALRLLLEAGDEVGERHRASSPFLPARAQEDQDGDDETEDDHRFRNGNEDDGGRRQLRLLGEARGGSRSDAALRPGGRKC